MWKTIPFPFLRKELLLNCQWKNLCPDDCQGTCLPIHLEIQDWPIFCFMGKKGSLMFLWPMSPIHIGTCLSQRKKHPLTECASHRTVSSQRYYTLSQQCWGDYPLKVWEDLYPPYRMHWRFSPGRSTGRFHLGTVAWSNTKLPKDPLRIINHHALPYLSNSLQYPSSLL